jgi:hypothetical protein
MQLGEASFEGWYILGTVKFTVLMAPSETANSPFKLTSLLHGHAGSAAKKAVTKKAL